MPSVLGSVAQACLTRFSSWVQNRNSERHETTTIVSFKLKLSDEVLAYLRRESLARQVPLDEVVSDALADYLDEPTKEDILERIREALRDGLAGKVSPVDGVLAELNEEFDFDVDES